MKISVIIPVYLKENYLATLFKELHNQTFKGFESFVVDDGSYDLSGYYDDEFAISDERIISIHKKNGGVSHARNIGLDFATADKITFVDADDELPNDYLENLNKSAESSNADIVIGTLSRWYPNTRTISKIEYPYQSLLYKFEKLLPEFVNVQKQYGLFGWCPAKLVSRNIVGDVRFDESIKLAEDFDFYLRIYPKVKTVYFDNECNYLYTQGAENSSVQIDDSKIDYLSQLKINLRYKAFLERMNCYCGENKRSVDEKINNYIYFTLLYCPIEKFEFYYDEVYLLKKTARIPNTRDVSLKSALIYLTDKNKRQIIRLILRIYRKVHKLIRNR